ncbi:MAG: ATP-binding protein [Lawsonibacter sp.]
MPNLNQILLDSFPEAAVLIVQGQITAANLMARHYLPHLEPGAPVPSYIPLSQSPSSSGTFAVGLSTYSFRLTQLPEGLLILFRPAPQTALTDIQLDGTLRQLRSLMEDFLLEAGSHTSESRASFYKSFYRMFRLVDNLELIRAAGSPGGLPFSPVSMDLAGLCSQIIQEAAPLLLEGEITLEYQSSFSSLLIPGDPKLLQRLLLELISNAARAASKGTILIRLFRKENRAFVSLSDSSNPLTQRQLVAMLQQDSDQLLPSPESGAGLGLSIVRHIVSLHGGALLVEFGQTSPAIVLSLPTGPLNPRTTVSTPSLQLDGGLSPLLAALADALPASVFQFADFD